MSIFFAILVRIASYGPQIDLSHGENRLSHIIIKISIMVFRRYGVLIVWLEVEDQNAWGIYSQLWTEKYREKTRTLYQSRWWPSFNSGQVRKLKFFFIEGISKSLPNDSAAFSSRTSSLGYTRKANRLTI